MDFRDKKQQGMDHYDPFLAVFILPAAGGISGLFFVESGVAEVDVGGVHLFLAQADAFTEPLEVNDLPLPQEADYVVYIRVVGQPENVIVGEPCLLLGGQVLGQIGDDVAGGLDRAGAPGEAGGGGGVDTGGVVHEVWGEGRVGPDLLVAEVPGQLVDDGRHHLHMAQLLCAYKGVKMYQFRTGRIQWFQGLASRLPLHLTISEDTFSPPENRGDEFL